MGLKIEKLVEAKKKKIAGGAEKRKAVEEIQEMKRKALAEVAEREEAEKRKAIEEIQEMKRKALAEVADRQKQERQRSIVQMMKTHAAETVVERERAEAKAAKERAETAEAEAKAAKERAKTAETAETAETARLQAESSDETSGDEVIVHEEVSDEAARLLMLSPVEAEARPDLPAAEDLREDLREEEEVPSPPPSGPEKAKEKVPVEATALAIEPPPLPVIPAAASIPELEDEPTPMAPPAADAAIAAEAARAADVVAAAAADAERLRAIIAAAPAAARDPGSKVLGKGVPGASPRAIEAVKKDEAARRHAAEEAKTRLEEVEASARRAAAAAAKAVARAAAAPPPLSEAERRAWLAKHPYQPIAKVPFALSRHEAHDAELFDAAEEAVVAYLEEQVAARLAAAGAPAPASGLDDFRYVRMMSEFRRRRAAETEALSEEDRARYETERAAILNHIAATSRATMAERSFGNEDVSETRDDAEDAAETSRLGATAKALFSETRPRDLTGALTGERIAAAVPKVMRGESVRDSLEGGA